MFNIGFVLLYVKEHFCSEDQLGFYRFVKNEMDDRNEADPFTVA